MRVMLALAVATIVAGCGNDQPDEAEIEADVEAVRQMHDNPPPRPIDPERISYDNIEKYGLWGAGCGFAKGTGISVVLFAQPERAFMILDGKLLKFAADQGSASLPMGAWTRYTGGAYIVELEKGEGEGAKEGIETITWPGRLTVRDAKDRVVFENEGTLQCGS